MPTAANDAQSSAAEPEPPVRPFQGTQAAAPALTEAVERVVQAGDGPARVAFLTRALNALARLAPQLSAQSLGHAAGASTDLAVLVRALREPEALAALQADDPLAEARLRGLEARTFLVSAEGGTITAGQVAARLGLSRQAVDKRRRVGRLIALHLGRRGYAYPAWQFDSRGVLPGLEAVLAELRVRDPWMQAAFFLSGDPRLDGAAPLDQLRRGNVEAVRRAASGYGEHSAA